MKMGHLSSLLLLYAFASICVAMGGASWGLIGPDTYMTMFVVAAAALIMSMVIHEPSPEEKRHWLMRGTVIQFTDGSSKTVWSVTGPGEVAKEK